MHSKCEIVLKYHMLSLKPVSRSSVSRSRRIWSWSALQNISEEAQIGVLISMEKPTRNMRREAASAGTYKSPWGSHPRLQILTIEEILSGHRIDYPPAAQVNTTFKKAPKAKSRGHKQLQFPDD